MPMIEYQFAIGRLKGNIGKQTFDLQAVAGGGRGGDNPTYTDKSMLWKTKTSGDADDALHVHGGPLPPGFYSCVYIKNHPHFHECVRLLNRLVCGEILDKKTLQPKGYLRNDFFIHGTGHHGSDGCIVPLDDAERKRLNRAVRDSPEEVILFVGSHEQYRMDDAIPILSRTA